jgi:hypothetical protein
LRQVHQLFQVYGRNRGLDRAEEEGLERRLVETLRRFYATEETDLGVNYAGLCILGLPHRDLPSLEQRWHRELKRPGFSCSLTVEPGELTIDGQHLTFGVPFGPTARVILLYLQKEALLNGCREVELGNSMYSWMQRLGISLGGKDYRRVREQMLRVSACSLRFTLGGRDDEGRRVTAFKKDSIVEAGMLLLDRDDDTRQAPLWRDRVVLSETFYRALCEHPVPINLNAVKTIVRSSRALDLYVWLSYRLHALERSTLIPWPALMEQFGADYARLRRFRERFLEALQLALCVYPEARVEWSEKGVMLHPSPPAVGERRLHAVASPRVGSTIPSAPDELIRRVLEP